MKFFIKSISKLPFSIIYAISNIASFFLFSVIRYRRDISYNNIRRSFPDKSEAEVLTIQKHSYRYLTDTFFEICKEYNLSESELRLRMTLENFDEPKKLLAKGQPIIFLTAHTGPAEWMGHLASVEVGAPIDPVYKPTHNEKIDKFIFSIRSRCNATPIPYKMLAKDCILRKNVIRGIGILADLEPRSRDQVVSLDFLNQQTRFFLGAERVAMMLDAPVFFVAMKRTQRGHYTATAKLLSLNPKQLKPEQLTIEYAKCIESLINRHPHAWLWTHRRWKDKHKKNISQAA